MKGAAREKEGGGGPARRGPREQLLPTYKSAITDRQHIIKLTTDLHRHLRSQLSVQESRPCQPGNFIASTRETKTLDPRLSFPCSGTCDVLEDVLSVARTMVERVSLIMAFFLHGSPGRSGLNLRVANFFFGLSLDFFLVG